MIRDEFDRIIHSNFTRQEIIEMANTDNMPAVTPGEGGAFGLSTLLVGAALSGQLHGNAQLVALAAGALLACIGTLTHGTIRKARNNTAAVKAAADAEIHSALAYANSDEHDAA